MSTITALGLAQSKKNWAALAVAILGVAAFTGAAHAAVLASDSMNYTLGAFADGTATTGTGFSGNWSIKDTGSNAQNANIAAGLTYSGDNATNNSIQRVSNAAAIRALDPLAAPISNISGSTPGTTYLSFLISVAGNPGAVPNGVVLNGNQATSLFAGFDNGFSNDQTSFGLANTTSGTAASGGVPVTTVGSSTPLNNGNSTGNTTNLIVLKLVYTGLNTANVSLYTDPTAGTSTEPTPFETVSNVTVGTISSIGFDAAGGPGLTLDEIRVGDSFGDVVGASSSTPTPEPASLSLLALGAVGLLARRRKA